MRPFALFLLIAVLDGAVLAIVNWRWIEPALIPPAEINCPSAVPDALRQANDALAARRPAKEHSALVCLFETVSVAALSKPSNSPLPQHIMVFDRAFGDTKATPP